MDFTALRDEAEANKVLIDVISEDPQYFIDVCFADEVKRIINTWFDEYLEKNIKNNAKRGITEDTEYFTVTNRFFNIRTSGPGIESSVFNPFEFMKMKNFCIIDKNNAHIKNSDIVKQSYIASIAGIEMAYNHWINKFKSQNIEIIHIDEFSLSEKEYNKLCKSLFKFEKDFAIKFKF